MRPVWGKNWSTGEVRGGGGSYGDKTSFCILKSFRWPAEMRFCLLLFRSSFWVTMFLKALKSKNTLLMKCSKISALSAALEWGIMREIGRRVMVECRNVFFFFNFQMCSNSLTLLLKLWITDSLTTLPGMLCHRDPNITYSVSIKYCVFP